MRYKTLLVALNYELAGKVKVKGIHGAAVASNLGRLALELGPQAMWSPGH